MKMNNDRTCKRWKNISISCFFMDFIILNVQGLYKIGIKNKNFL